jgi:hypothetical protein
MSIICTRILQASPLGDSPYNSATSYNLCASKIASINWPQPYKENAARSSRDRMSLHAPRDYHGSPRALLYRRILVTCQVVSKILIQTAFGMSKQSPPKGYPFAKIVPNKLTKKCLLKNFIKYLSNII